MRYFYLLEHKETKEVRRCLSNSLDGACRLAGWIIAEAVVLSKVKVPEAQRLIKNERSTPLVELKPNE